MPIKNGAEYIQSLRGRNLKVYLFGNIVKEPVDHPMIRPSINAVAETYDIANDGSDIASAQSSLTGMKVNRFLHIAENSMDLVNQNKMPVRIVIANTISIICFRKNSFLCFNRLMIPISNQVSPEKMVVKNIIVLI